MNGHKTIPEDLPDNAGPGRCRYCLCWSTEDWAKPCPIVDNLARDRVDAAYGKAAILKNMRPRGVERKMAQILPTEVQGARTLEQMCDYAAERQRLDPTIIPRFEVMGDEMERIATYMATKHPGVKYQYSAIVFSEEQRIGLSRRVFEIRSQQPTAPEQER